MTEAMEKWVTEMHRKKGFPKSPAWPVQAEHYIRLFCVEVEKRARKLASKVGSPDVVGYGEAFVEVRTELLGGRQ